MLTAVMETGPKTSIDGLEVVIVCCRETDCGNALLFANALTGRPTADRSFGHCAGHSGVRSRTAAKIAGQPVAWKKSGRKHDRCASNWTNTSPARVAISTSRWTCAARNSVSAAGTNCCKIPYGETRSYAEIARAVGSPQGFRAVGQANHYNPIAIIVPCHRVLASGCYLGGYGGGLPVKAVSAAEGAPFRESRDVPVGEQLHCGLNLLRTECRSRVVQCPQLR